MQQDWLLLGLFFLALPFVFLTLHRKLANRKLRLALTAVIPVEIEFEDADPAKFTGLDREQLAQLTEQMETLGFERLRDYTSRIPGETAPRGFARLLVHRSMHCFAEIIATSQAVMKGLPLRVAINSYLEDEWDLGTSNVAPQLGHYFQQVPRVLRMRYSDAEPAELLRRHLARRAEILEGLGTNVQVDLSMDSYFARVRKRSGERRQAMQRRKPFYELPAAAAIAARRSYEWLGDFPKKRQRRMASNN